MIAWWGQTTILVMHQLVITNRELYIQNMIVVRDINSVNQENGCSRVIVVVVSSVKIVSFYGITELVRIVLNSVYI